MRNGSSSRRLILSIFPGNVEKGLGRPVERLHCVRKFLVCVKEPGALQNNGNDDGSAALVNFKNNCNSLGTLLLVDI